MTCHIPSRGNDNFCCNLIHIRILVEKDTIYIQSVTVKATNTPPPVKQFCVLIKIAQKDQLYFVIAYQNHIWFWYGIVQNNISQLKAIWLSTKILVKIRT